MKRLSFYTLSLLALILFSACKDTADSMYSSGLVTNNRATDGYDVVFSQGFGKIDLNYTNMTIQITNEYKDIMGQHNITTPAMKLSPVGAAVYRFKTENNQAVGGTQALDGYIDTNTGVTWYTLYGPDQQVYTSSHLKYIYVNTTITDPKKGDTYDDQKSAYTFVIDASGEKCILLISNFAPNTSGAVQATEIQYNDLTLTPTASGYIVTADKIESSIRGYYTITDLNFVLDNQGLALNGSFKCNDLDFNVTGSLFPLSGPSPIVE